MEAVEKVLREVEESSKKIKAERKKMKPKREMLRYMDNAGALTASQRARMTKALGQTPGRKAEPEKAEQATPRPKPKQRTEEEKAAQRSTGARTPKPAPEPGRAAVLGMQQ
jgi:hypothetical protein